MTTTLNCACQSQAVTGCRAYVLERFALVREECPAIKNILVPDDIWPYFEKVAKEKLDEARHVARVLLALELGYLNKLTYPIHKYLLDDIGTPKQNLKEGYRKDLQERWIYQSKDFTGRHEQSRGYAGKLTELMVAEWLEQQGWKIKVDKLEALGGGNDIEAISPENVDSAIEVKHIGMDNDDFLELVEGLHDKPFDKNKRIYPEDRINYLLFIIYTAANKLIKNLIQKSKIAIIVLSPQLGTLKVEIQNAIDWKSPKFKREHLSCKGKQFFNDKCLKIKDKLSETIQSITGLWIIQQDNYYNYSTVISKYYN